MERLVSLAREGDVPELEIRVGVSQVLDPHRLHVQLHPRDDRGVPRSAGDRRRTSSPASRWRSSPGRCAGPSCSLGRWLGLAVVVVGYTVASGALAIAVVVLVAGFGPPHPELALAYLSAQALVLMTLTLALGSVLPAIGAGAIAVVAFGIGWMAGVLASVATALGLDSLTGVAEASRWIFPSDGLWRGVVYGLEPPIASLIALGRSPEGLEANPFFAFDPPPLAFVAWAVAWIAIALGLAAWRLVRRDL